MDHIEFPENDYDMFYKRANAYYPEGEGENFLKDETDAFIRFMFDKVAIITTVLISGIHAAWNTTNRGFDRS